MAKCEREEKRGPKRSPRGASVEAYGRYALREHYCGGKGRSKWRKWENERTNAVDTRSRERQCWALDHAVSSRVTEDSVEHSEGPETFSFDTFVMEAYTSDTNDLDDGLWDDWNGCRD